MRTPLPVKVSTLGGSLGSLTAQQATERTQQLMARANRAAHEAMADVVVFLAPRRKRPMNDGDKIQYLYEHGRWPSPSEQDGY